MTTSQEITVGAGSKPAQSFPANFEQSKSFVLDLISLMKPRVLSLLLISTICPMFLAAQGDVPSRAIFLALLGGFLISGSASVFNCVWDRDIDAIMERTKNRAIPAGRIAVSTAVIFGLLLGVLGYLILNFGLNTYAALIALFGHFFYVFVYTIWLKRITPQNIVIGGAAGAIPPLVGWVGVRGQLDFEAILLFLIIFLWTPPHFWALALNKNSDYQKAGVPMLPVVAGESKTHLQMLLYALSLIPISMWLVAFNKDLGFFSYATMLFLGIVFSYKVYDLMRSIDLAQEIKTKKAWDVFGFSLVYLALFFVCIVVDSIWI